MSTHMALILFDPVYTIHASPLHCGDAAVNGDMINPIKDQGVQWRAYNCDPI